MSNISEYLILDNYSAKVKIRLAGIRFTASIHTEVIIELCHNAIAFIVIILLSEYWSLEKYENKRIHIKFFC